MWCPVPDCNGYDIKGQSNKLICNKCLFIYCSNCSHAWHENSKCDFKEARTVQLYMEAYNLYLCPRCKIMIDLRATNSSIIQCTKCKCTICKCCGGGNACVKNKMGYNLTLFDICYNSLLLLFLPFHTFIFAYLNLKYIKAGITGTKSMIDFTTRYSKTSYILAFLIAILLIPIYFLILPIAFFRLSSCPFIVIKRRPKFQLIFIFYLIMYLFLLYRLLLMYVFLNVFGVIFFPYRIIRLLCNYFFNEKPNYGRYGLKSRFRAPGLFFTKLIFI